MATPMEYDTLREVFYSAISTFARLTGFKNVSSDLFKDDEDKLFDIWNNEVRKKDLEDVNYSDTVNKLIEINNKWEQFEDSLEK